MDWKNYSHLRDTHAFLSPSRYYWVNYDSEKLISAYENHRKTLLGTQYHLLAAELISLAVRLPHTSATFNSFVNDAIGFKMKSEVLLYYSPNCYGTADAISFHDATLRVHDLKTGKSPGSINQVLIYAGLFCLDYGIDPKEIQHTSLRIYQNEEVLEFFPSTSDLFDIVVRIQEADKTIEAVNNGGVL